MRHKSQHKLLLKSAALKVYRTKE